MDFSLQSVPKVTGMSLKQIEREAEEFLKLMEPECLQQPRPTPVLSIFEDKLHLLGFKAVYGKNVKGLPGVTNVTKRFVELTSSTHGKLEDDVPNARFTVAHEFGHVVLHAKVVGQEEFPSREDVTYARRSDLKAYEDPEWQANAFAASVLMPEKTMRMLYDKDEMTIENVMETYKVSYSAASRRVMRLQAQFDN